MALIECAGLTHVYLRGTPLETVALRGVSLSIEAGEIVALIGPTGSGKSTLVQHFNALLRPTEGTVRVAGVDLADPRADLGAIRRQVGLVFQYPEHQLFEETVAEDVAFGPRSAGLPDDEVRRRVRDALLMVGMDPERVGPRSPFSLSGGEMRRVAIAGILAMGPQVLVLDEPTAGLDPLGKEELRDQIRRLHADYGLTVIFISHHMDEVARMARRVVVLSRGQVVMDGPVREVFRHAGLLAEIGLGVPSMVALMQRLRHRGLRVREDVLTVEEAHAAIREALGWSSSAT